LRTSLASGGSQFSQKLENPRTSKMPKMQFIGIIPFSTTSRPCCPVAVSTPVHPRPIFERFFCQLQWPFSATVPPPQVRQVGSSSTRGCRETGIHREIWARLRGGFFRRRNATTGFSARGVGKRNPDRSCFRQYFCQCAGNFRTHVPFFCLTINMTSQQQNGGVCPRFR